MAFFRWAVLVSFSSSLVLTILAVLLGNGYDIYNSNLGIGFLEIEPSSDGVFTETIIEAEDEAKNGNKPINTDAVLRSLTNKLENLEPPDADSRAVSQRAKEAIKSYYCIENFLEDENYDLRNVFENLLKNKFINQQEKLDNEEDISRALNGIKSIKAELLIGSIEERIGLKYELELIAQSQASLKKPSSMYLLTGLEISNSAVKHYQEYYDPNRIKKLQVLTIIDIVLSWLTSNPKLIDGVDLGWADAFSLSAAPIIFDFAASINYKKGRLGSLAGTLGSMLRHLTGETLVSRGARSQLEKFTQTIQNTPNKNDFQIEFLKAVAVKMSKQ